MATWNKFNNFSRALATKKHNIAVGGDTLKIALCATANAPTAAMDEYADLTPIALTNLSSVTLNVSAASLSTAQYQVTIDDLTLSASGGSSAAFQYVVVYNDTATNKDLIGWIDYASALTLASGESLLIDFTTISLTVG